MAKAIRAYRRTHLMCEHPGCPRIMHQVDHIIPLAEGGDRYNHHNMQSLCEPHHQAKTVRDAQRGKTRAR